MSADSKKLYLISCGTGEGNITLRALEAIKTCGILLGAERLAAQYAPQAVVTPADALKAADIINDSREISVGILLSGDAGFHSLATKLRPMVKNREIITIPGVGVVQSAAARLNTAWQGMDFISLHASGVAQAEFAPSRSYMILTRKGLKVEEFLDSALLNDYEIWIMEKLYSEGERICPWDGEPFECRDLTVVVLVSKQYPA